MKRLVLALAFASLFLCCQRSEQDTNVQSELKQVQNYQKSKHAVSDNDKFAVALETIETSQDEALILRALVDIQRYSENGSSYSSYSGIYQPITGKAINRADAEDAVENLVRHFPETSAVHQKALFTKAIFKLQRKQTKEGIELFRDILKHGWETSFDEINSELVKALGWADGTAAYCSLATDPELIQPTHRNFVRFFLSNIIKMRRQDSNFAITQSIRERVEFAEKPNLYGKVLDALCLIAKSQISEAERRLDQIEDELESDPNERNSLYGEWRNIPLYRASGVYRVQGATQELHNHLTEFWKRNQHRPAFVVQRGSEFYHWRTSMAM
ncbi:hypothetical protein K8I31_09305, partial [bacterium]|nr:hypothetical protein [bacterium]